MKNILFLLIIFPAVLLGQTNTRNYVKTLVYKDSTVNSDATKANTSITYYDGLGRPMQKIDGKQSGVGKDLIRHIEYDGFGRQSKEYLPYAATTDNLAFDAFAQSNTVAFYNTSDYENTSNPYNEKFFESSPLDRVKKQGAPGTPWLGNLNNDNDHTLKYAYLSNTSNDAVKKLSAVASWNSTTQVYDISFSSNATYAPNTLTKTITQNENKASGIYTGSIVTSKLNTTEEFKNQLGQVVLKRTFNLYSTFDGTTTYQTLDTYYVYDQFGNLSYVLPPLANGNIAQLDALCYQYKYDYRDRLVEKKVPGKAWEYFVYDKFDRIVAAGPTLNPWDGTSTGWMITKFDIFGRAAYTGWYAASGFNSAMRKAFQDSTFSTVNKTTSATTIDNIGVYYTNSFPTSMKVLTINYYDNYTFSGAPSTTVLSTPIYSQPIMNSPKGQVTGSWVRVLDLSTSITGELTYTLYDKKGKVIRTRTTNFLGGYTQADNKLDFDGTLKYTVTTHKRSSSSSDLEITTQEDFTYNAQDRLFSQTHKIGTMPAQLMAENTYNDIGLLTRVKVGNTSATPLQKVDYAYNVRGWLKSINDPGLVPVAIPAPGTLIPLSKDLFVFKINYNNIIEQNMSGQVVPLYNGNIAETTWRTASDDIERRYGYTYDTQNRLRDAWYQIPQASTPIRNSYDEHVSYDINGNILTLHRNGELDSQTTVVEIDNLAYTYSGNQLTKVTDSSNNTAGFKDVDVTSVSDYNYDIYGNMLTDLNKGIIKNIIYNHLNLPTSIAINNNTTNGTISYLYNAAGVKLKKTVIPASTGTPIYTDYLGGYQYVNNVLEFFPTSEGYVKNTVISGANNYNYVFQYKDHLGNNRVSYSVDPADGLIKILEEDHYYPFGLKHNGYSANQQMIRRLGSVLTIVQVVNPGDVTYKYMYLGQERQDELGLNWDTFRHRNYDAAIGRFFGIDPITEKYTSISPYQFAHNNPVWKIELEGLEGATTQGKDVLNTKVPDDLKVHATIDAKATINLAINHIGDQIGYENLSGRLEGTPVDNFYNKVLSLPKGDDKRGETSDTTKTQIDETDWWNDTEISITTEISSISIIAPDTNIGASSTSTTGNTKTHEGSAEVGGGKEGVASGKVGYKTAVESKVEDSSGVTYNMYTAKIYLTVTIRTSTPEGTPVTYRSVVSVTGSVSTTLNFQTADELKN